MRRSRSRRGRRTRRPQVTHLTPMSAPSRTTLQSRPPQGCGFLSRTTSPTANGIGSELTIKLAPPCAALPRCKWCRLHQSRNTKATRHRAHLLFGDRVGTIHCVLNSHGYQIFENLDVFGVDNARVDRDAPEFPSAGHLCGDNASTGGSLDDCLRKLALHGLEPRLHLLNHLHVYAHGAAPPCRD